MYLFIFEDGDMKRSTGFSDDDKASCDAGLLDVIDLHAENPKRYFNGEWQDIDKFDA